MNAGSRLACPTLKFEPARSDSDKAHVVHFGDGDKQVRQRGGGHDAQIGISHGNGDGVFQIGWEFVQEENQRITAEQLLPRLGSRGTEHRRDIAGELLRFAELLRNRSPDAAGGIGASAIESGNTARPRFGAGFCSPRSTFLRKPGSRANKPQRNHAVRLAAAHGLREQEDRRTRASAAQMAERPIHQA